MAPYIDPRAKLLWHTDRLDQLKQTGKTSAPINVEIDLSNRCSHGCSWCHFSYTHTRGPWAGKVKRPIDAESGGDLMPLALVKSILRQLAAVGVRSVTWSGGGEPTLHPQFDEIIATHALEQGLYSHGGHIDEKRAALLKQACTWVYISLDECDPTSFKASKGVDRFMDVLRGIARLVKAEGKATIGLGFLLHRDNYHRVDDMVTLGKSLGVDYIQFRPVVRYDQKRPGTLAEDTGWVTEAIRRLRPWTLEEMVSVDIERFELYRSWMGHPYKTCHWTAVQTVITPNGKVWRCANKREHAGAEIGDLTQESFSDIWQRASQSCAVDGDCRIMCRGHLSNLTLDAVLTQPAHENFI